MEALQKRRSSGVLLMINDYFYDHTDTLCVLLKYIHSKEGPITRDYIQCKVVNPTDAQHKELIGRDLYYMKEMTLFNPYTQPEYLL